jgi:3-oxoacyl-[acyl-carrier protein] reductase
VDWGLAGKVALVTGASSGIGLATSTLLMAEGADVVTVSRGAQNSALDSTFHISADLFERGEPERAIAEAVKRFGRIDLLVNNVGHAVIRKLEDVTDDDWDLAFRANVLSAIRATRAALPSMIASGDAAIVNVASTSGRRPSLKMPDYSVAKAALLAYSRQVAETYAPQRIRCNAVVPGPTLTRAWLGVGGLADQQGARDDVLSKAAAARPMGRFAEPEEIANVIVFLCSAASSHVTGAEWSVSGGSVP